MLEVSSLRMSTDFRSKRTADRHDGSTEPWNRREERVRDWVVADLGVRFILNQSSH